MTINKEITESYCALADINVRHYIDRRSYEWKVNFGLWTAVAVLTNAVLSKPDVFQSGFWYFLAFYASLFLLSCFLHVPAIQAGNAEDKKWIHYYKSMAEGINAKRPDIIVNIFKKNYFESTFKNAMWWATNSVTLVIFAISLYCIRIAIP